MHVLMVTDVHRFHKRASVQYRIHHACKAWLVGVMKVGYKHSSLPVVHNGSMGWGGIWRRSLETDFGEVQEASGIFDVDVFAAVNGAAGLPFTDKLIAAASRYHDGQTFLKPDRKPDPGVCGDVALDVGVG